LLNIFSIKFDFDSFFFIQLNLNNEPHERSNVSMRSGDIQAGKTARYNVNYYIID
jgi:hypothetical protein